MAFYKLDNDDLLCGPNFVRAPSYSLFKEEKDTYDYPVDGWYWFKHEEDAREFFGLPPVEEETEEEPIDPNLPPL